MAQGPNVPDGRPAERAGLEPSEVEPLLNSVLEVQCTGTDRRDLETGMELVYLALEASL